MRPLQPPTKNSHDSRRHTHTHNIRHSLSISKPAINRYKFKSHDYINIYFRMINRFKRSTQAQKASCGPRHNQRKRHLHPVHNVTRNHELSLSTKWRTGKRERMHTAAYFSTKGRKTGSSNSALSETSWRRPSFSPLKSSLIIYNFINNHISHWIFLQGNLGYSLEVRVVED